MLLRLLAATLLVTFSVSAQTPAATTQIIPTKDEPHHRTLVENAYVRAFRVHIDTKSTTLPHRHDTPYVYVMLGAADVINAVVGQPESAIKLPPESVRFSPGRFVHLVRTDAGVPFDNVTVELLQPQSAPRNLCEKIVAGDVGKCDLSQTDTTSPIFSKPLFETDQMRASSITVNRGEFMDVVHDSPALLIAVGGAAIRVARVPGRITETLNPGDVMWLPRGAEPKYTVEDGPEARLVLLSFTEK